MIHQNGKTSLAVSLGPVSTIPDRAKFKLKYVYIHTFVASSIPYDYNVFRLNDMYDPYQTGVGSQPQGFDQWMAFYNHFVVTDTDVKITFNSQVKGFYVWLKSDPSTTIDTNTVNALADPRVTWSSTTPAVPKTLKRHFNIEKLFGIPMTQLQTNDYSGDDSSSPISQQFMHVQCETIDQSTGGSIEISYAVEMIFHGYFYGRKDLELSFQLTALESKDQEILKLVQALNQRRCALKLENSVVSKNKEKDSIKGQEPKVPIRSGWFK